MKRDFKDTYEQRAWQHALERHAWCKRVLNKGFTKEFSARYQRELDELEREYPKLKEI